jgi:hypothetical protein
MRNFFISEFLGQQCKMLTQETKGVFDDVQQRVTGKPASATKEISIKKNSDSESLLPMSCQCCILLSGKNMPHKTIDEIIESLPRSEQVIVKRLRSLVHECLPKAEEKSYDDVGFPFYRHNRLICFIWPPSVYWDRKATLETQEAKGVALGFNQGNLMSNQDGVLLAEGRKQVHCIYFHSLNDIDEDRVRALLFEAGMIDDRFKKKRK